MCIRICICICEGILAQLSNPLSQSLVPSIQVRILVLFVWSYVDGACVGECGVHPRVLDGRDGDLGDGPDVDFVVRLGCGEGL